jgi:hypothetical protein
MSTSKCTAFRAHGDARLVYIELLDTATERWSRWSFEPDLLDDLVQQVEPLIYEVRHAPWRNDQPGKPQQAAASAPATCCAWCDLVAAAVKEVGCPDPEHRTLRDLIVAVVQQVEPLIYEVRHAPWGNDQPGQVQELECYDSGHRTLHDLIVQAQRRRLNREG